MASFRILSWNVQKFGDDKLKDKNFIAYVARVIRLMQADVVGIMELVGWQGNEVGEALVTALNNLETINTTGVTWKGAASEMTPSRPNEQYLFLWKDSALTVVSQRLVSVVGGLDFDNFFDTNKWSSAKQETLWESLIKHKYLSTSFQVPLKVWSDLLFKKLTVDLTKVDPKVTLTAKEQGELRDLLLLEEMQYFPVKGSRPPYLLGIKPNGTTVKVTIMLFHAPGPGNALPVIASNQLTQVPPIQDATVGVVMGDFNVNATDAAKDCTLQYFNFKENRLKYVMTSNDEYVNGKPFQRLTGPKFTLTASDASLTAVQNYGKLLWAEKTSLTTTLTAADTVADATTVAALGSSEYDKFFVREPNPGTSTAAVVNLIDRTVPKSFRISATVVQTRSTTLTTADAELSRLAAVIYNAWWDRQNAKKRKSNETIAMLADAPKVSSNGVASLREAQYAYRNAISDHLPICMELHYA